MTYEVQISFRNMEEDGLEEYVREQAAKLERFCRGIVSCRVMVEAPGRRRHGHLYHVRIDLRVPGGELVVKHEPSLHTSLQKLDKAKVAKGNELGRIHRDPRRAISDAFSAMRRKLQDYVRVRRGKVKKHVDSLPTATVETLFPDEGYGFLATSDGKQVYFHRNSVLDGHFDQLQVGSSVRFAEEMGEQGPQASTVHIVHPHKQARAATEQPQVRL